MSNPATPSPLLPSPLLLVGCGKMGGAMLEGWLRMGLDCAATTILDPHASPALVATCEQHGISLNPSPASIPTPQVILLGIKPQMLDEAAPGLAGHIGPQTLLVSILAGKTIADLRSRLPRLGAVVRAMPNLPAAVQRGVTGAVAGDGVTPEQRSLTQALLSGIGSVEWVEREDLIDAVTAVSGSGPAYVFYLTECLARAGAALGLPDDLAARLARATVEGAGELMHRSDLSPGTLRENVTSPAGTTAAALAVLMADDGLDPLMRAAVAAACRRAGELSG